MRTRNNVIVLLLCLIAIGYTAFSQMTKQTPLFRGATLHVPKAMVSIEDLQNTATLYSSAPKYDNVLTFEVDRNVGNTVPYYQNTSWTATINLELRCFTSTSTYTTVNKTYTLKFDATKPDAYNLPRISEVITTPAPYQNRIEIYVMSLNVTPNGPLPQLDDAFSVSLNYKRSGILNPNFTTSFLAIPSTSIASGVFGLNNLTALVPLCDEIDVEWLYIDKSSSLYNQYAATIAGTSTNWSSKFLKFSRVTVPYGSGALKLPAIYNDGCIVYRIRQVYYDALKNRLTGNWIEFNTSGTKLNAIQLTTNHNSKLNWTSSISFAEEGKHKDVVTYFDGAQRDRQSVTYDNSSNRPIIAETYYDKEGRKSAAILPAPHLTSSEIKYYPDFNLEDGTLKPYDAENFSYLPSCISAPKKLSNTTGAAHYYSPSNILKNDKYNQFIPDAEGYPLTISEYTNDNTGRIRRQTGVGADFQFDKEHFTEYLYSKPSAEELDRLFGTDVGYSSHYFKNTVIDPNGQQSITYTDLSGKTIATALEGSATNTSIVNASNNTGATETINMGLIKPNEMRPNSQQAVTSGSATLSVPFDQVVKFTLSNDQVDFNNSNCKESFCSDCYYDIDFTVKDNCGTNVNKFNYKNYDENDVAAGIIDINCNTFLNSISQVENISLKKGENYVTIDVKIPPKIIDFYEKRYLESDRCITTLSELIEQHRLKINPMNCIESCDECKQLYGDVETNKQSILKKIEQSGITVTPEFEALAQQEAEDLSKRCKVFCDAENECELKRSMLLADVSPGGQYMLKYYKDHTPPGFGIEDDLYVLHHLNTSGLKKKSGLPWNFPAPYTMGGFPIKSNLVPDIDTLVENWTDEIAEYLVQFHPEYCYYEYCRDNNNHLQFISDLQKVETWSEAITKGYLVVGTDPMDFGMYIANNLDPYFIPSGVGHSTIGNLESIIRNTDVGPRTFNIFELAVLFTSPDLYNSTTNTIDLAIFRDMMNGYCSGQKDAAWLVFRNLYIDAAKQVFDDNRERYVRRPNSGCISADDIGICKFNESLKNLNWWMRLTLRRTPSGNIQNAYCWKNVRFQNLNLMRRAMEVKLRANVSNVDDEKKKSADSLRIFCDSTCINMANGWIESLSFCPELEDKTLQVVKDRIANIKAGLIAVCRSSCGEVEYPNGAASVSPKDKNANYHHGTGKWSITLPDGKIVSSFQDVINAYIPSTADRAKCNALFIDYPEPYYVRPQFEPRKLMTQVDTCSCENLKIESTLYLLNPQGASSLYDYLQKKYPNIYNPDLPSEDFNISEEDFNIFVESCRDRSCKYLPKSIEVPYVLECAPRVTCDQFNNAKNSFIGEYGFNPLEIKTQDQQKDYHYKKLWAGYLNEKLGVNANYVEYEKFAALCDSCRNHCNIADFIQGYVDSKGLGGKDLSMSDFLGIAQAYNTANGTMFTPEQILVMFLSFRRIDCFELTSRFYILEALPKGGVFNTTTRKINGILKTEFDKYFKAKLAVDVIEHMFTECMVNQKPITDYRCDKPLFSKPHSPLTDSFIDDSLCARTMDSLAVTSALEEYHKIRQESLNDFKNKYISRCLTFANTSLMAEMNRNEFHYTLYYYGQDGNLLATVPPAGTKPLSPTDAATVPGNRNASNPQPADHLLKTTYEYNSLNQVIKQNTPDGGTSQFIYDQLGRLILSQNAQQATTGKTSYTLYDRLGRIYESGEMEINTGNAVYTSLMTMFNSQPYVPYAQYLEWYNDAKPVATFRYITRTYYDQVKFNNAALQGLFAGIQQNLRHRIASITLEEEDADKTEAGYNSALHYSYDVLGNVNILVSENNHAGTAYANQKYKTVHYDYDLVSGKVNKVNYQKGKTDQFVYKYTYDAENRIKNLFSSKDDIVYTQEAQYEYYLHGPLARTIYGEDNVQGIDYAYTLQGWLKGINASTLDKGYDMGRDGDQTLASNINSKTATDAIALTLKYHQNDYKQIARTTLPVEATMSSAGLGSNPLYNGNISSSIVSLSKMTPQGYQYTYDQLNRLVGMGSYVTPSAKGNDFSGATLSADYAESIQYDPNGNILKYFRNMNNATPGASNMDDLAYQYYYYPAGSTTPVEYDPLSPPIFSAGDRLTNQLASVRDALGAPVLTGKDIGTQSPDNYKYDEIGNLIRDDQEGLDIEWTPTGKIAKITNNNNGQIITFAYDPMGNRIMKTVNDGGQEKRTYYTRDAQGNPLAIYANAYNEVPVGDDPNAPNPIGPAPDQLWWIESPLYGSSRIGSVMPRIEVANTNDPNTDWIRNYFKGKRQYELTNHLGNVLATIKDEKRQMQLSSGTNIDFYEPIIYNATDYYPFGMPMPNRTYSLSSNSYRFGFNGQEKDDEIYGEGNLNTAEFWEYDTRIGRRWNIDPMFQQDPDWSPYRVFYNNPLFYNDPDGLWERGSNGQLVAQKGDNATTLSKYLSTSTKSEVSYDRALDILKRNNITPNEKGILNLKVGDNISLNRLAEVVIKGNKQPASNLSLSSDNAPWMDKAFSQIGVSEVKGEAKNNPSIIDYHSTTGKFKTDETPWCASFVNWSLVRSNVPSINSARAFDYKKYGTKLEKPAYGAIAIMNYSHVGFVAGTNSDGRVVLLGGNQGDAVNLSPNSTGAVLQYRYPNGYTPTYVLPKYKLKGRSLNRTTSR